MGCQKTYSNLFTKLRYTDHMQRIFSKNNLITIFSSVVLIFAQGCEFLEKRDIQFSEDNTSKETRNFKLLAYLLSNQIAVSESSDSTRYIRNNLSSITSATLVTTKESSFMPWHQPTPGCVANGSSELNIRRIRFNLNMGVLTLTSESTGQQAEINFSETSSGPVYGAMGWLPSGLYTWSSSGSSSILAWQETAVPALQTGGEISFWSDGKWTSTSSPDLDLSQLIVIKKDSNLKIKYRAPSNTNNVTIEISDSVGNNVTCNLLPSDDGSLDLVQIPKELLSVLETGTGAKVEVKFHNSRLNQSHLKIDEIFVQNTSRHVFGRLRQGSGEPLDFGTVEIIP